MKIDKEIYLSSGQSQRAYCASQGEPLHVLNYWLGKYRRSHRNESYQWRCVYLYQ